MQNHNYMTSNEKLNFLLLKFKDKNKIGELKFEEVRLWFETNTSDTELTQLLDKLLGNGYISYHSTVGYNQKLEGNIFIEKGGYVQQEIERQLNIEAQKASVGSYTLNKWILIFTIIVIALTIIGLIKDKL